MIMAHAIATDKTRKTLCLLFCVFLSAIVFGGCAEKKSVPKEIGSKGACEIFDALPKDIAKSVEVNYEGKITLLGITVDKLPQNKLKLSYFWKPFAEVDSYNTVFVHFTNTDNKGLFGNDHEFCPQRPFSELKGKFVKETFTIDVPASTKGQEVLIKMGFYDPVRGGRLKIVSAEGLSTDDANTRALIERLKL